MAHKTYIYLSSLILIAVVVFAVIINLSINEMNRYVIKVNGEKITLDEFKVYMKVVKKEFEARAGASDPEAIKDMWEPVEGSNPVKTVRQNAFDMVVEVTVSEQRAKELGIQLTEEEVGMLEKKIRNEGTVDKFDIPEKDLLLVVKGLAVNSKLSNYITRDAAVTEQELDQYLAGKIDTSKKYTVRHVLITTRDEEGKELPKDKQDHALELAKGVYKKAKDREDFSKLAKEYSNDPGSKDYGGLFEFYMGEAVKEFEEAVKKLKPGEVSEPVKTAYGYHIIRMETASKPTEQELASVRKKYKDQLLEAKRAKTFEDCINELKKQAKIEKNDKLIDSIDINEI